MKKKDKARDIMSLRKKEIIDALNKIEVGSRDFFLFIHRPANKNKYSHAVFHTPYRDDAVNMCASFITHLTSFDEDKN